MIWPFDGIFGSSDPPAAAKPAPPPTTAGASTAKPTQECPRNAKHPCDINKLMLKATGREKDKPKVFKLETTKVRRREPVTDVKDSAALTLLRTYDLLIDVLAEPKTKMKTEPAEIEGRAYYTSPACETQSHPLLKLIPLGKPDALVTKKVIGAEQIEMAVYHAYAFTSIFENQEGRKQAFDNAWNVFGIIESFIEAMFGKITEVDLNAYACGKRARGDGGNLNEMLLSRVRVFRASKWAIGLKIPPLGSFKREHEQTTDVHGIGTTKNSTDTTSGFNTNTSSTKSSVSGQGALANTSFSQSTQAGSNVSSYSTGRTVEEGSVSNTFTEKHSGSDGRSMKSTDGAIVKDEDIKERLDCDRGFDLILSIDDKEIEVGEGIEKIKKLIEAITEAITDVKKLYDAMPQVGWKFTFDVSVFAGSILAECEPEYVEGVKAAGRYYAVQHKFSGKIEMKVFSISAAISFGVEAKALDSGLVLKIRGQAHPGEQDQQGDQPRLLEPQAGARRGLHRRRQDLGGGLRERARQDPRRRRAQRRRRLRVQGQVHRRALHQEVPPLRQADLEADHAQRQDSLPLLVGQEDRPPHRAPQGARALRAAMSMFLVQLAATGCTAELYLNGVPLTRLTPNRLPVENVAAELFLVPGTNRLDVVVEPGSRPSVARTEYQERSFRPMSATGRLLRFEEGVPGTVENGELLGETTFVWADGRPDVRGFPAEVGTQIEVRVGGARWEWLDAPPLVLDDALVAEACALLDEVERAIRRADVDRLWRLTEKQIRDVQRAYPALTESHLRGELAALVAHTQKAADPVFTRDRSRHDFRLVGGDRMVQLVDDDFTTSFKLRDPDDGSATAYRICLARVGGQLRIVR